MNASDGSPTRKPILWLATLAGLWLLFNLIAMPLAWAGMNATGGIRGAIQVAILLGFLLILLFDLVSLLWLAWRARALEGKVALRWIHLLGLVSLVGLMGAKVMVDEIARETPLGRAGGEWGVLYALLMLQLSYVVAVWVEARSGSN